MGYGANPGKGDPHLAITMGIEPHPSRRWHGNSAKRTKNKTARLLWEPGGESLLMQGQIDDLIGGTGSRDQNMNWNWKRRTTSPSSFEPMKPVLEPMNEPTPTGTPPIPAMLVASKHQVASTVNLAA